MREIEAQPIGCDKRTGLMDVFAQNGSQRGMEQMGSRVIPFRIVSAVTRHAGLGRSELELSREPTDGSCPSIDRANIDHVNPPAVTDDLAAVRDLPA